MEEERKVFTNVKWGKIWYGWFGEEIKERGDAEKWGGVEKLIM